MTHQEFSRKGGKSKSKAKAQAGQSNLAKARDVLAKKRKSKLAKHLKA